MGKLQIYTGDGKGKTTCSIGLSIRAAGSGMKVFFLQFDKGGEEEGLKYSERNIIKNISNITFVITGLNRRNDNGTFRFGVNEEDIEEGKRGLELSRDAIISRKYNLVVLDEIVTSIKTGLIKLEEVFELVELHKKHNDIELVMTGRSAPQDLIDKADLVTEMKKIKHYFDEGQEARLGIEF